MTEAGHETGLIQDPTVWLAVSFAIFAAVIWKFGKKAVLAALDARIAGIKKEIETAETLRVEAQELLAQYQRKQRDAEKESVRILEEAKKNAYNIKKAAEKDLKETIKRKEVQLEERLVRIKQEAIEEIQAYAADLAIKATREIIAENLDKKAGGKLIDDAIRDVSRIH